jgi:WD40 repeat protein
LVAGSSAWLFNATTGEPIGKPFEHGGAVEAAAFSHDGRIVATGGWDNMTRLWDTATGTALGPPLDHGAGHTVRAMAFSPDGTTLLTGCGGFQFTRTTGGDARLWDVTSFELIGEPIEHRGTVAAVAFSPDGKTFMTVDSHDGLVRLWEAASQPTIRPIGKPLPHVQPVASVTFTSDNRRVITGNGYANPLRHYSGALTFSIWDAASGRAIGKPIENQGWPTLSPDGRTILFTEKSTAQLWDADTGKPLGKPLQHLGTIEAAAFSPDARTVLTGSGETGDSQFTGEARLWDARTGEPLGPPLPHQGPVKDVAYSPTGKIFVTGILKRVSKGGGKETEWGGEAQFWDSGTRTPIGSPLQHQGGAALLIFSPDGASLLMFGGGTARLWDSATLKPIGPPFHADGGFLSFNGTNRTVLTRGDSWVQLLNAVTGDSIGKPVQFQVGANAPVASTLDCKTALVGGPNAARLWDLAAARPIGPTLKLQGISTALAFSPDGSRFLTSGGATAQLWEAPDPPLEGEARRIVLWTEVITGMRLDNSGDVRPLTAKDWQQRHDSLQKLGGAPLPGVSTEHVGARLPWLPASGESGECFTRLLKATAFSFTAILLPGWFVFYEARRRRWLGLAPSGLVAVALASLAFFLFTFDLGQLLSLRLPNLSAGFFQSSEVSPILSALAGLPLAIFACSLLGLILRRQWRRSAHVLGLTLLLALLIGGALLWMNVSVHSLSQYSWEGWYLVAWVGVYAVGVLTLPIWLLRKVLRE